MTKKIGIILLYVCLSVVALAQSDSLSVAERNTQLGFNDTINRLADDFIKAYLVVADPSPVTYSTLGHACLRLQCNTFDKDYMFSYEGEGVENKIWRFLMGDLKMGMFHIDPQEYIDYYAASHRGVQQYKLNLPSDAELRLWEIMDREEMKGPYLPYDYLERGCAQSILQFITKALYPKHVQYAPWPEKYKQTRREFVSSNLENYPWADCWFSLAVGIEADMNVPNVEKVVIPTDLVEVLQDAEIEGKKIITDEPLVLAPSTPRKKYRGITPNVVAWSFVVIALFSLFLPSRLSLGIDWIVLGSVTLLGLFLTYILMISHLPNTSWIWLIIPFNLLPIIFWKWRKYWAMPYALVLVLWILGLLIYPHVLVHNSYLIIAVSEIIIFLKQTVLFENIKLKSFTFR